MDKTFPQTSRLRRKNQYEVVRQEGKSKRGLFLRLSVFTPAVVDFTPLPTQCGIIVSRRVGNAVVRHRIKRRLRELYRHERSHLKPGLWLVLTATPQAAKATFAQLGEEWHSLGNKLSLFQASPNTSSLKQIPSL